MSTAEKLSNVVTRLLQSQGHRDTQKNRKALVARYFEIERDVLETEDEILLWTILNTSEPV